LRILAIDGAGPIATAAGRSSANHPFALEASITRTSTGDADLLPSRVGACLAAAGWKISDVDVIACAVGPGGFTSIRVAVALARALALAADRPVIGVTSFEAIARRAREDGTHERLRVVVPGGRGNWFVQDILEDGRASGPPVILADPPWPLPDGHLVGSGGGAIREVIADAVDVARVAAARLAAGEQACQGSTLVPLYMRGADARIGAGRSLLAAAED
jgi:tRNA threonylcarbamoyladenosine biosynthesis protein TsaB